MTGDGMLASASTTNNRCEANFYYGEWLLAKRRDAVARTHFQTAAQVCTVTSYEGPAARAELKRLP
jgi:rhomboid protease GluP